jgi:hypothetical protein
LRRDNFKCQLCTASTKDNKAGQTADILSKQLGKKVNYVNVSDEDARKGIKDMGMDEWTINSTIELFEIARAGYASAISSVAEQITGKNL